MILGAKLWNPWKGKSRGYAYIVLMAKPKSSFNSSSRVTKVCTVPALSTLSLSLLCGSALLSLALLSMIMSRLVDSAIAGPRVQLRRGNVFAALALSRDLQSIPAEQEENIWDTSNSGLYFGCSKPSPFFSNNTEINYLLIETSGGLNQQRTGITDAVVVARMLNATLVVPSLDHNSYWKDSSNFSDIFDVEWFINFLAPDVPIVKALPAAARPPKKGRILTTRVPRKCTAQYYRSRIAPLLQKRKVLRLTKFDYRLSNVLDPELQKLRCRANYHALQFIDPIMNMGRALVQRMRQMSGRYIALHLRYEADMLAFSGCYYGGGDKEVEELGAIRRRWKSLHVRSPERERRNGKCPLTPEEVGLMLRALGFGVDSYVYVASGDVYGGEASLAPLKKLFPNYFTKETLATKEELQPFVDYSSRMAALDYIVCDESNVFVTNNNGNMARILAGRRRYFGHKKTIRPNTKKLGALFLARRQLSWKEFASKVKTYQTGFMGEPNEAKPGRGEFHENPTACICERGQEQAHLQQQHQEQHQHQHLVLQEQQVEGAAAADDARDGDSSNTYDMDLYLDSNTSSDESDLLLPHAESSEEQLAL